VLGHEFVNMSRDSLHSPGLKGGFYDVISPGKITLLAKRVKTIQRKITMAVEMHVFEGDQYYLKINNVYTPVNTQGAFLRKFADRKSEVQKYMKQNKLNYRSDREGFMKSVVAYYNQL
jgi:hypothetical protein